ncbi:MAG TPA: hypothetical protein VMU00_09120 [Steroidobacteraceae bacterium]|nr:hypothetical protein [Steroidobacteraceae bacterium]
MATPAAGTRKFGSRLKRWLALGLIAIAAGAALWTWGALSWAYSEGERAGLLQKFSRKGWLCKTYEGELAMYVIAGVQPEIWHFSVRDPKVAEQLKAAVGERVQLHYAEHRGVPTDCFAESEYYVDRINTTGEPLPPGTPVR